MTFSNIYKHENFEARSLQIADALKTAQGSSLSPSYFHEKIQDILRRARQGSALESEDLLLLLSDKADTYLDEIIDCSQHITRQHFGRIIQFYAPLYLSNHCHSTCTYCGFSRPNSIKRLTLSLEGAVEEALLLKQKGIHHILLLTGEDYKKTPLSYLEKIVQRLSPKFASVSIEVYPFETDDYRRLRLAGLSGVSVYQETYDAQRYRQVHLGGMKKRMTNRLNCPDRIGEAGIRFLSIGALLGLSDPAADVFFTAMHARYLMLTYWQTELSVSLPRLRPAVGLENPPSLSDKSYTRYFCAMRLFLPKAGLYLSTRESPAMRDYLSDICITHMSVGSKTEPGGYSGKKSTEQFSISDNRSLTEISKALTERKLDGIRIDWNPLLR